LSRRSQPDAYEKRAFDAFVEDQCEGFYSKGMRRPSLTPGRSFRLLLISYFEGIEGKRGIARQAADSLALRQFLELKLRRRQRITRRFRGRGA
jgi:transposase